MGLDIYLSVNKYISGWEFNKSSEFDKMVKLIGFGPCKDSPSIQVDVTVMYWRKANAIHSWFVRNVQGGVDECQRSYVRREHLEQLVSDCKVVLKSRDEASKLLPTASGFFFGGTNYDEYYFEEIAETAKRVQEILDDSRFVDCGFYYRSSW